MTPHPPHIEGHERDPAHWWQCLREHGGTWIDCQQVTSHLASLGARPIARELFFRRSAELMNAEPLHWSSLSTHDNLLNYFGMYSNTRS